METKICTKCGEPKPINRFNRHPETKDGKCSWCNDCKNIAIQEYQKTKDGLISTIYSTQRATSRKRGDPMPTYTLGELREWMFSQRVFHELYDNWKESGYNTRLRPSCDRLDDYKPYTLDNLRVVTWRENNQRYMSDSLNGINTKQCISIIQFIGNVDIAKYYSINSAARKTEIHHSNISACCNGRRKFAGGSQWRKVKQ